MKRRSFFKGIGLAGLSAIMAPEEMFGAGRMAGEAAKAEARGLGYTLWQLASQVNTIGNSYVLASREGKVVVMDGGVREETPYLRGFLAALGNEVEAWFISHPHPDHMGALNEILKSPGDIKIRRIIHSRFTEGLIDAEPDYSAACRDFYSQIDRGVFPVEDIHEAGNLYKFGSLRVRVLGVTNDEFRTNPYNNSSMILRVCDGSTSVVFLGDAGVECGNKALNGPYAKLLDCDYIQVAHHGQQGCDENFYKTVKFKACLWPTPLWVWNNDGGGGINTAHLKTFDTRRWMDEKGIKEHHVSCLEGLWKLA